MELAFEPLHLQQKEEESFMIGISVAANKEWNYVKEYFSGSIKELSEYIYGEYFETQINDKTVLIYKCGARKSNASASTQYIIDRFNPEKIILIGTAAGVNNQYNLADILIPGTAIQGDGDFIEKGQTFRDRNIIHIDLSKYSVAGNVTIASRDKPLVFKEDCELLGKYDVDICDMEAAPVANICQLNNTEIVILKGISDFPGKYDPADQRQYQEFVENVPKVMRKILNDYLCHFI